MGGYGGARSPHRIYRAAEDPGFWKATNGKGAYTIVTLSEAGNVPGNVTPLHMNKASGS